MPSDICVARYRDFCKDWEARGWRIDSRQLASDASTIAYAIPSPARRQKPKGWVLPVAPLRKADARAAACGSPAMTLAPTSPGSAWWRARWQRYWPVPAPWRRMPAPAPAPPC